MMAYLLNFSRSKYSTFDDAVIIVRDIGQGCFMAKIDIKHAFRLCPAHPDDWPLLCYQWLGQYFFDTRLPFGSRSSPFIFNIFADALAWILIHKFGVSSLVYYLDHFFVCALSFEDFQSKVNTNLKVFRSMGSPSLTKNLRDRLSASPSFGLKSTRSVRRLGCLLINFPTFQIYSVLGLHERNALISLQLLSLIGLLSFACKVIKPGWILLRRLIDLSTKIQRLHHHVDITSSVYFDLNMWSSLLGSWNGVYRFLLLILNFSQMLPFEELEPTSTEHGFLHCGQWMSLLTTLLH